MIRRPMVHGTTRTGRQTESGVALLTVLALLSIFAVVLVGFTFSIRMEENTIKQYADSVNVQESTEAAIQGVLAQLARDLDPIKPNYVLGRSQPNYTSLLDPWALGYAGKIGNNMSYDARSHQLDVRPQSVFDRSNLRFIPTPIPRGVDEDPPGDVTGMRGMMRQSPGDGAAGLKGIDDDLDGEIDGSEAFDDDEDYRIDEDQLDTRRDGKPFPAGTGYDADGDMLGVFDEAAKININLAGNNFGQNNGQTYNLGVSPSELDLPVFIFERVIRFSNNGRISSLGAPLAENIAKQIVSFRYGSVYNGGSTTNTRPGEDKKDDNNNGNPEIVEVQAYGNAFDVKSFDGEPFAITGNQVDDDGDGFLNEEDEHYIGPSTENSSGSPLTEAFKQDNAKYFRPGDKIDNNGDGYIDENREGIDDPGEFSVFQPKGDDRPYTTVDDLRMVGTMRTPDPSPKLFPTLFDILKTSTTIYSQADEISGPLSGRKNEVAKVNPNLSSNWLASDLWSQQNPSANKADFQYSPKIRMEDLLVLQVDNDGDWQSEAEVNLTDEKDNDGDGLIDEPSDDWDQNHYPSGDFDGFGETDPGAPAFVSGTDFDRDQQQQDKVRSSVQEVIQGLRLLGWEEETPGGDKITAANFNPRDFGAVNYESKLNEIIPGLVVEGDGIDSDGDLLNDDLGDFNGDGNLSYDPEWHVSEDAWGDLNGDGYPGLGGDPEADSDTPEGQIVKEPDNRDDLLRTSLADDDHDGYADFYDPQVLAAMLAPEWDGVDNDNDGEVDEIGERYIACFDDDEDGRMDEDPPEFQIALNLIDYIDAWMQFPVSEDVDVRKLLGKTQDDPVLADPVTFQNLTLYSSRQRAFRMHPRILTGPNMGASERQEFSEQMRLMLPNPPLVGMPVKFEGVEAIRINEVMAKPVIRLEAEEVLEAIQYTPTVPPTPPGIAYDSARFNVLGNGDDGVHPGTGFRDTNWGIVAPNSADGAQAAPSIPSYSFLPNGFVNTLNPFLPVVNMDSMAPAFIFSVTNISPPLQDETTLVGRQAAEVGEWTFTNIPAGFYNVVLYMHPSHGYNPNVTYEINGKEIPFRSDTTGIDPTLFDRNVNPLTEEILRRDTALHPGSGAPFRLPYRLTPSMLNRNTLVTPNEYQPNALAVSVNSNGILQVRITAGDPGRDAQGNALAYATSFDRIELIAPWYQYVELVNISTEDIDLSGWTIDTPYGHYIIPEDTIIGRMKPSYTGDDGREMPPNQGMPGDGVPSEPLLNEENIVDPGGTIASTDLLLEDNKLLLANNKNMLIQFVKSNYPDVPNIEDQVVQLELAPREKAVWQRSLVSRTLGSSELKNAQTGDLRLRLVDVQEDILTHNPADKHVTLSDPSGHYMDSFKYRTTFNNAVVDIPDNGGGYDLVALPGYRGMETFERSDPTYFETEMVVDRFTGRVSGKRSVPSSIKLDAEDAIILNLDATNLQRAEIGGYIDPSRGTENDRVNSRLRLQRFADQSTFPVNDSHWNGWDFIGDYYEYPKDNNSINTLKTLENQKVYAREAVAPAGSDKVAFYQMLGGFENALNVRSLQQVRYTAFVWRMGLRELIRAGYDPDVDDQLTVRLRGRKAIDESGQITEYDLPVGEVLVIPTVRAVDPGKDALDDKSGQTENNPLSNIFMGSGSNSVKMPVFAKLRNGDTAATIDLRQRFDDLNDDLNSNTGDEPEIEIMVVIRKSTIDHGGSNAATRNLTVNNRSDLETFGVVTANTPIAPDNQGNFRALNGASLQYIGNLGDDNYFFKGIELFGRGREGRDDGDDANARRSLLAGTPGRDNTGYVPAYPRRRLELSGKQRDDLDIIDNTAYVKNGPLASVGELSRLFTGNRFETVNTPLIPQRVEDVATAVSGRVYSSPDLGKRSTGSNYVFRKTLAQRERLDQWENQYTQLYNMITTAEQGIRAGVININTAPREVLMALPFCPPVSPGKLEQLKTRSDFNSVCADFILEGRQPGGHDMHFGVHNLDDDDFLTRAGYSRTLADTLADFKLRTNGREFDAFKVLDDIESDRFGRLNITIENIEGNTGSNIRNNVFLATEITDPDDGPFIDTGTLLSQMLHLKRRDRFSDLLQVKYDRTLDKKVDDPGDLRERLNEGTVFGGSNPLTTEEMEAIMNRISNLITVRSRAFSIITKGRVYDSSGNITAQRKLEAVYER